MKRWLETTSVTVSGGMRAYARHQPALAVVAQRLVHRRVELRRGHHRLERIWRSSKSPNRRPTRRCRDARDDRHARIHLGQRASRASAGRSAGVEDRARLRARALICRGQVGVARCGTVRPPPRPRSGERPEARPGRRHAGARRSAGTKPRAAQSGRRRGQSSVEHIGRRGGRDRCVIARDGAVVPQSRRASNRRRDAAASGTPRIGTIRNTPRALVRKRA